MFRRLKFLLFFSLFTFALFVSTAAPADSLFSKALKTNDPNKKIQFFIKALETTNNIDSLELISDSIVRAAKQISDSAYVTYLKSLAKSFNSVRDIKLSEKYYSQLLKFYKQKNEKKEISKIFISLANNFTNINDIAKAVAYYDSAKNYIDGDSSMLALIYNGLGATYSQLGFYELALENYQKALNIIEKKGNDLKGLASLYNNIGLIHKKQQNYETALEYFNKALQISMKIKDTNSIIGAWINMGFVLNELQRYDEAKKYLKKALKMIPPDKGYFALYCLNALGDSYKLSDSLKEALDYYNRVLEINKKFRVPKIQANTLIDIAWVKIKLGDTLKNSQYYAEAINNALQALDIAKKIKALPVENKIYKLLYTAYSKKGDYFNAFKYAVKYIKTNEKIFNQEKTRAIQEMETKYETDKKQQEIEKQKLELQRKDAIMKKQQLFRNALIIGALMLLVIVFLIYGGYKRKKRDNEIIQQQYAQLQQANEEIRVQHEILQEQKERIEHIHSQLTASINYAERIQLAAMPKKEYLDTLFEDYFILYKPLQIVSGDFYWAKKIGDHIIFAVADCTGHGVPGAFVSMLGISLLNEITQQKDVQDPKDALEILRQKIKESLKQSEDFEDSKDGMDMALCAYNTKTRELKYAGANSPAIIVRADGTLEKLKPVRNPVAYYLAEKPFESISTTMNPGDMIYLFSDGIVDQFGGENRKKFTIGRLKELLLQVHNLPCKIQKQRIEETITAWMNGNRQLDDITIMGVRF